MLQIQSLFFSYENHPVLNGVSFHVFPGQSLAIMGESGSGKSTLLKLIYGLLDADSGKITWRNHEILGPRFHLVPGMEFMKYLAQDFDLMPFTSVYQNVGQFISNIDANYKHQKVMELLELVDMVAFANVKTKLLSGGQMQRVALAKVLALEPEVLLLDEPFSHIDTHLKRKLSEYLFSYCKKNKITVLFITHHAEEAMQFADQLLILNQGTIEGIGTPKELYCFPNTVRIAQITGEVNVLPGEWFFPSFDSEIFVRPHQLAIDSKGIECEIVHQYFLGAHYLIKSICQGRDVYFYNPTIIAEKFVRINLTDAYACSYS